MEYLASLTALIYVFLAARDNNWCWPFAAVSSLIWAYVSLAEYRLVSDALLQLFYFGMAGVGLYRWRRGAGPRAGKPIVPMTLREHSLTIVVSVSVGLLLGYTVASFMTATATYLDAITTAFSISATFLLIERKLDNWLYWIVIDLAYVYIYANSGAWSFVVLMVLYVIMAGYGYYQWRRLAIDRSYETAR